MIIEAQMNGDNDLADKLKRHFRFKQDLTLRAEHVFYYELVKLVPALTSLRRVLDQPVLSKLVGKAKCMEDPRPDYFHFDSKTNIALHGEFDEQDDHEESMERLRVIAHHAGCGDRVESRERQDLEGRRFAVRGGRRGGRGGGGGGGR